MKVTIPKPCHEDWSKMTPEAQGRFCSSCAKTVVDFTKMNKEEIKTYFVNKSEERTCGRFLNTQLDEKKSKVIPLFDERLKKFAIAVYVVFGFTLFSCTDVEEHTVGDVEPIIEHVDSTKIHLNHEEVMGDVEPEIEEIPLMGEPMMEEEIHSKGEVMIQKDPKKTCSSDKMGDETKISIGKPVVNDD